MSWALTAYRGATGLLEPLAPTLLRARARRGKEDPARLSERLGRASHRRPEGRLAWLHGASVGEGLSLLPLVKALTARDPELNLLVTSGTATSAALLGQRLPERTLHQFLPVDAPGAAAGFLDHWRPELAVFVESELWPNLLLESRRRGARTALISARLSKSSVDGWARFEAAARKMVGGFDLLMPQDAAAAEGLIRLGGRDDGRLNLKLAGEPLPVDAEALADVRRRIGHRPVWLAASTHPGEEALLLEVFAWLRDLPQRPLLVIAPRHPARGSYIAAEARAEHLVVARRAAGEAPTAATEVYVADTLGELGLWYRLSCLAVIGGSLVGGVGGHNPLEAARLDCPIAVGAHVTNWRSVYAALEGERALHKVEGAAGLAGVLAEALSDPAGLRAQARRAAAFAARESGAVDHAAQRLVDLLKPAVAA